MTTSSSSQVEPPETASPREARLPRWDDTGPLSQWKARAVCTHKGTLLVKRPHWKKPNWRAITPAHLSVYEVDTDTVYVIAEEQEASDGSPRAGREYVVTPAMLRALSKHNSEVAAFVNARSVNITRTKSAAAVDSAEDQAVKTVAPKTQAFSTPFEERPVAVRGDDVIDRQSGDFAREIRDVSRDSEKPNPAQSSAEMLAVKMATQFMRQAKAGFETIYVGMVEISESLTRQSSISTTQSATLP